MLEKIACVLIANFFSSPTFALIFLITNFTKSAKTQATSRCTSKSGKNKKYNLGRYKPLLTRYWSGIHINRHVLKYIQL